MMIGYLALGIFAALTSGVWALMAGFGLLAALGFYALGGGLVMTAAVGAALYSHLAQQPNLMAASI
jgi:hypothetical protein